MKKILLLFLVFLPGILFSQKFVPYEKSANDSVGLKVTNTNTGSNAKSGLFLKTNTKKAGLYLTNTGKSKFVSDTIDILGILLNNGNTISGGGYYAGTGLSLSGNTFSNKGLLGSGHIGEVAFFNTQGIIETISEFYFNKDTYTLNILPNSISPTTSYFMSKLGIGLTKPNFELDVSGDINFTGSLLKNGSFYSPYTAGTGIFISGSTISSTGGTYYAGTGLSLSGNTFTNTSSLGTGVANSFPYWDNVSGLNSSQVFYDDNFNYIGIGLTNPSAQLHLYNTLINTHTTGVIFQSNITQNSTVGYTGLLIDINEISIGSGEKNPLQIKVGGNSIFKISNTGLGTFANAILATTVYGSSFQFSGSLGEWTATHFQNYYPLRINLFTGAAYREDFTFKTGYLLGIGNTNPVAHIDVALIGSTNPLILFKNDKNAVFDSSFIFTSQAYLGIGNTNPTERLMVNGNILISNTNGTITGQKFKITELGGFAIKLIAGENLSEGNIVFIKQSGGVDGEVFKAGQSIINSGEMSIGAVYADATMGSDVWVVVSGMAYVLPETGITATRGYVLYVSTNTGQDGRVQQSATTPGATEVGHFLNTGTGNGNKTIAILHQN